MSTRVWMMREDSFREYSSAVRAGMASRTPLAALELSATEAPYYVSAALPREGVASGAADEPSDGSVLVIPVLGPVTRSGGACSYGSIDHRDMLLEAADDPACLGVVFILDTPGGSAFSLHDYRQGLDSMKAAGKRSVAFVDGMCASAGVALACQCDYVCAMNPHDEIGCIGAMAAFCAQSDGAVDADGFRFVSITATQTPDKNAAFRDAADGDYTLLQRDIDKCAEEFLALIDEMRPQVKASQRTGKMYEAGRVIGSLVDAVCTMEDCLAYVATGEAPFLALLEPSAIPASQEKPDHTNVNTNLEQTMNIENICTALGISARDLHVEEEGIFLNEAYVETLNEALAPSGENTEEALVEELTSQVESLDRLLTEATEQAGVSARHLEQQGKELAVLKAQLEEQVTLATRLAESNTAALEQKDSEMAQVRETVAELTARVTALDAELAVREREIEEMAEAGAPAPQVVNQGTEKASEAAPAKSYREMSVHEKAAASIFNCKKQHEKR